MRRIPLPTVTVFSASTTAAMIPVLGYMEASDWDGIAFDIELRGKGGNLEVAYGYQTADVDNSPDAAVAVTSYVNANGVTFRTTITDIASTTAGKRLIRPVLLVKLSSGSTLDLGAVTGTLYIKKRT